MIVYIENPKETIKITRLRFESIKKFEIKFEVKFEGIKYNFYIDLQNFKNIIFIQKPQLEINQLTNYLQQHQKHKINRNKVNKGYVRPHVETTKYC